MAGCELSDDVHPRLIASTDKLAANGGLKNSLAGGETVQVLRCSKPESKYMYLMRRPIEIVFYTALTRCSRV